MRTARWNRSAGANTHSREARGKHTSSSRYKSGDNWVECQRCGHDIYGSDAMEDGYTQGLIVCPKCYDAPHPQDYVRAYEDRISPGSGMVTGETGVNLANGLAGSTSNPAQTSFTGDDITGSLSAISDQTNAEADTISTLSVATNFPTSIYDTLLGAEQTVASWAATGLPAGLSIDSSGDITGTVGGSAFDDTPYTVLVTATFTNGYTITNAAFNWDITELNDPDTISGLGLWWDFSERDGTFVWSYEARTSAITNGGTMRGVTDRSGNGKHGDISGTGGGNPGTWDSGVHNTNGAFNAAGLDSVDTKNIQTDSLTVANGYTLVGIAQVPSVHATKHHALLGHTGVQGTEVGIDPASSSGFQYLWTWRTSAAYNVTTSQSPAWSTHTGQWFMWIAEINGAASGVTFNNAEAGTPFADHDSSDVGTNTLRVGAGTDGSANNRSGWNAYIGEVLLYSKLLSTEERNTIFSYMQNKWILSDNVA